MKKKDNITLSKDTQEDLHEIKSLVRLIAGHMAIQEIERLVSTNERKAIWFLCSGKLTRESIVSQSGISLRTVTSFIDMAKTLGLLEEEKERGGHPRRVIDYAPSEWKEFVRMKKRPSELEPTAPAT
jgi:Fic family protein